VRTDRSTPANAPMQTPVDMSSYTAQFKLPEAVQARAITPTLARRPPIEMPLAAPKAIAVGQNGGAPLGSDEALELNLDLDVPAFLRRSEG